MRATWGLMTSSPGAEGDWTCGGLQGSAALRAVFAGYRRAEVQLGSTPTSAQVPSAAARAIGTPGWCISAG